MSEHLNLDLSQHYNAARDLRGSLREQDEGCRLDGAKRFLALQEFQDSEPNSILRKKISLRQAKQVIAMEHGYEDWPQLRLAIETKVEAIQNQCEGPYFPKGLPAEPGDVLKGDLILLGTFSEKKYVVDAILMDLFEAVDCPIGPGVVLLPQEPVDFDPSALPDLPEGDEGWDTWSLQTAQGLGIEGA